MQLLFDKSLEFGEHRGLGLVPGEVVPIARYLPESSKVPSIGWKRLDLAGGHVDPGAIYVRKYFYFVHSFMVKPDNPGNLVATYRYDGLDIPAVVRAGNVTGVQFHPEKSGEDGLKLLREFASA
jgi:glutamine amidotransferase